MDLAHQPRHAAVHTLPGRWVIWASRPACWALLTVIPAVFMPAVAAYTLGHCAWWIWLGVLLLRKDSLNT